MASVFAAPPSQLVLSSHRPSLDHKAFLPSIVGVKFHRNGFPIPSFREFLLVCVFSSPLRSIALDTIISEDIWTVTLAMSMLTWKFICCLVLLSESTLILVMEMEFGRYKNTKRLKLRQRSFSITASNSSDGNSTKEKKDGSKVTGDAQGPPFLTILAGFFVFSLVLWIVSSSVTTLIALVVKLISTK